MQLHLVFFHMEELKKEEMKKEEGDCTLDENAESYSKHKDGKMDEVCQLCDQPLPPASSLADHLLHEHDVGNLILPFSHIVDIFSTMLYSLSYFLTFPVVDNLKYSGETGGGGERRGEEPSSTKLPSLSGFCFRRLFSVLWGCYVLCIRFLIFCLIVCLLPETVQHESQVGKARRCKVWNIPLKF